MSETKKAKTVSKWAKDDSSVRIIPGQLSPQDQTAIDLLKSSQLPKAAKDAAIQAIRGKSGAIQVHMVRHEDASVEPLFTINGMRNGVKISHVLTILDNAEFIRSYIDEQSAS